jgi:hypothetical protein
MTGEHSTERVNLTSRRPITTSRGMMEAIRDMYDLLPPDRGAELRRRNKERLAELEAAGAARRERLAQVIGDAPRAAAGE